MSRLWKKRSAIALVWLFALLFTLVPAFSLQTVAAETEALESTEAVETEAVTDGVVYDVIIEDTGNLFTDKEKEKLLPYFEPLLKYGHVALLTTVDTELTSPEYTENFYKTHWDHEPAAIMLIDLANGFLRFNNREGMVDVLDNDKIKPINDRVIDYASDKEYYLCIRNACLAMTAVLDGASPEDAIAYAESYQEEPEILTYTNSETQYQVVIQDDAELLSDEQRADLMEQMKEITAYGHVAFVTTEHNDHTAEQYCNYIINTYFGKQKVSVTMVLIDMENRYIRVQSDGEINEIVDDDYADTITDNIYKYASNKDYYGCAKEAFTEILALLQGESIAQPMKYISNALLALILAVLIMFVVVTIAVRQAAPSNDQMIEYIEHSLEITDLTKKIIKSRVPKYTPSSSSSSSSGGWFSGGSGSSGSSGSSSWSSSSSSHSSSSGSSYSRGSGSGGQHKF